MWLFTKHGFVDLVQHPHDPDQLLIRAQVEEDMTAFVRLLDEVAGHSHNVSPTFDGDYRFVVTAAKDVVAHTVTEVVLGINYSKFKRSMHFDLGKDNTYVVMLGPHDLQVAKLLTEEKNDE